jgi:Tol biopolymer transport system component
VTLAAGSRLGPYEVLSPLGAGGMGEVWRARDTKLGREVALKVLPLSVAADPERLARFEREAQLLASLNHPHIGAIYGLEESGPTKALVLELIEGPTLQERIAQGALPVEEALSIGRQIAEALEAAHEKGVIHRDLKPQNVKITPDGEVKVLDFGLAKALDPAQSGAPTTSPTLMNSPTLTAAGTQLGVILGTAAYMAPEQARGGGVDKRADIWAFGAVLWEMLTGRRLFAGDTVTDTLAGVLKTEIDWNALPAPTPPNLRRLLERCLTRDRRQRLHDIGDARLELDEAATHRERAPVLAAAGSRLRWPAIAAALVVGVLLGGLGWRTLGPRSARSADGVRLSISIPKGSEFLGAQIAPDGRTVSLALRPNGTGPEQGRASLFLRRLDAFELTQVSESEGFTAASFSSDGAWIYFTAPVGANATQLRLARAPVDGRSGPVTVRPWENAWQNRTLLPGGDVVATLESGRKFVRLPADGGAPSDSRPFDGGTDLVGNFYFTANRLPDGRSILGLTHYGSRGYQQGVAAADLETGKVTLLVDDAIGGAWLPNGELLFGRGTGLLAAKLDGKRSAVVGAPRAILNGLRTQNAGDPYPSFVLSASGTLLYPPGGRVGSGRRLVIVDPAGRVSPWSEDRMSLQERPAVAAQGGRVAHTVMEPNGLLFEIWISDPGSSSLRRLVSVPGVDTGQPVVDREGSRLAFRRYAQRTQDGLYLRALDGKSAERRLVAIDASTNYLASAFSPDGTRLLAERRSAGNSDVVVLALDRDPPGEPAPLLASSFDESDAVVSPDGNWLAYVSNESGRNEVYMARWLENGTAGPSIPVSRGPGRIPRWMPDGKAIVYDDERNHLAAATVTLGDRPGAAPAGILVDLERSELTPAFDVLPDGRLLVVARGEDESDITQLNVITGFTDGLAAAKQP